MIHINVNKLNPLELSIHNKLSQLIKENENVKIVEAAEYCDVSSSKISKFVRKLGFDNFKQYKLFLSGEQITTQGVPKSSELERLKHFIDNFDPALVEHFLSIFNQYNKIVLFGLGPSFICVEYFAYKLALLTGKSISVAQSEDYAGRLLDKETLLIVFSVTGKFSSFENLLHAVKASDANMLLILEEYNTSISLEIDNIFYLTDSSQDESLLPFEKTRTIFFIFIEEVIAKLMSEKQ